MSELNSVSYDQYRNIPSYDDLNQQMRIVFSGECYKTIMEMSISAMNNNKERGCFFVGRMISKDPKVIYIDYSTSEFIACDGPLGTDKAVSPSNQSYVDLNNKISYYKSLNIEPVVMHFHSHPRIGYFESFSDQDLEVYAKMQAQNLNCWTLGMLGFPINMTSSTIGMCVVRPENSKVINGIGTADFVRCENIYYILGNELYKVGNFDKMYTNRLNNANINFGIVRTYLNLPTNGKVCAEGINPNTGKKIEPKLSGYIDSSENLYFTDENISLPIVLNINSKSNKHY